MTETNLAAPPPAKKRRTRIFIISMALALLLAAGVILAVTKLTNSPIPKDILYAVDFPLYYPKKLPDGFQLDSQSIELTDDKQAVVYVLENKRGERIFVSQQAKPKDFDFDMFHKRMTDSRTITTNIGSATTGMTDRGKLTSIVAADTWIIISSPASLSNSAINHLANQMSALQQS